MDNTEHLAYVLNGGFIARAVLNDYIQVIARLENCEPKDVEDRVLAEAQRLKEKWSAEMPVKQ
jgi:hypothetical protein